MASNTRIILTFVQSLNSQNWKKEYESATIINCPSLKATLKLLSQNKILPNFFTSPQATVLHLKIFGELIEKDKRNFLKEKTLINVLKDKRIVISFESKNECWLLWKLEGEDAFHSTPLDANVKESFGFVAAIITKGVRENRAPHHGSNTEEKIINLPNLVDSRNYNFLMLAAEAGNLEVVKSLLSYGFSVNLTVDEKTAADFAYENNHQSVLLTLLKADSKYPKNFDATKVEGDLKLFIDIIDGFFKDTESGKTENIQEFITKYPHLRHIYNQKNQTAAAFAIVSKQIEVYKILLENSIFIHPDENFDELTKEYIQEELETLKRIHDESSKENPDKHIKNLTSMSLTSPDEKDVPDRMKMIEQAYFDLNVIPGIELLLKAVAKVSDSNIFFDFNRQWVNYMNPSLSEGTNGTFNVNGTIYIAAKGLLDSKTRNKTLAVIAHEFCHFVVNLSFDNSAKPYDKGDNERRLIFQDICREYKEMNDLEQIIEDVFECYDEHLFPAELIVRVPQLFVAYHKNQTALEQLRDKYSKLFNYYADIIVPRIHERMPSIESFLVKKLKDEILNREAKLRLKDDEIDRQKVEIANVIHGGTNYTSFIATYKNLVPIVEIRNLDHGGDHMVNHYMNVDGVLMQPKVEHCKVVIYSIAGDKVDESFVKECLEFLYANYSSTSNFTSLHSEFSCESNAKQISIFPDVFLAPNENTAIILMVTQGLSELSEEQKLKFLNLNFLISSVQMLNTKIADFEKKFTTVAALRTLTNQPPFQKLTYLDAFDAPIDETINNFFESVDNSALSVENSKAFIESTFKPLFFIKKSVLGRELTCGDTRNLIHKYLEIFLQSKLPNANAILDIMIKNQMGSIVSEQLKDYVKNMKDGLDCSIDNFKEVIEEKHVTVTSEIVAQFLLVKKFKDETHENSFLNALSNAMDMEFENLKSLLVINGSVKPKKQVEQKEEHPHIKEDEYNQNKNSDTFGFVVSEKPGNTAHLRDETTELPCINTTDISSGEVCENAFAQSLTSEEKIECFRQMDVGIENPEKKSPFEDNEPVHVMEVKVINGQKEFYNNFDVINDILLNAEVKDRKVAIMSIIGDYRKGKSFLLDYCLRFMYANYASVSRMNKPTPPSNWMGDGTEPLKGFSWKHGRTADTKGILFWSDVFLYDSPEGEKIAIIIMDTQGLFEIGSIAEENAKIFGLSTLISSIQIVNVQGVIKENDIEFLEMTTSLTKVVTSTPTADKRIEWKFFQKLIFLVRDCLDDKFGFKSGQNYLVDFLSTEKSQNSKTQAIRKNIHASFDQIICFVLNHPGTIVMNKNFKGGWKELDNNFVENLKLFIETTLSPENLVKKSILGKEVTGRELKEFIVEYFKAFSDTKLPEVENILQMTIDNQMKAIVAEQLKGYQNAMNENIDHNRDDFESWIEAKHERCKAAAVSSFKTVEKLCDIKTNERYDKILKNDIEESYKSWSKLMLSEYKIKKLNFDIQNQVDECKKLQQALEENLKRVNELEALLKTAQEQGREEEFYGVKKEMEEMTRRYEEKLKELKKLMLRLGVTVNNENREFQGLSEQKNPDISLSFLPSKEPLEHKEVSVSNTDKITYFFKCIDGEFEKEIKIFLEENSHLRHIFNANSCSAASHAIKLKKFDILKILFEFGVFIAPYEKLNEITLGFTDSEFLMLKGIFDKHKVNYQNIGILNKTMDGVSNNEDVKANSFTNEEKVESLKQINVESEIAEEKPPFDDSKPVHVMEIKVINTTRTRSTENRKSKWNSWRKKIINCFLGFGLWNLIFLVEFSLILFILKF